MDRQRLLCTQYNEYAYTLMQIY